MNGDPNLNPAQPETRSKLAGSGVRFAAWAIVLLALVHFCWLEAGPGSELRKVCPLAPEASARHAALAKEEQMDRIADRMGGSNAFLTVDAGSRTNPAVESYLAFYYYRISYALYPRRLYVAPPDKVINTGADLQQIEFTPGPEWLRERDVGSVLQFGGDVASGRLLWLESVEKWEHQARMLTNNPPDH